MADMNSTPTHHAKRPATAVRTRRGVATSPKVRVQTCEPIPAYGVGDGVLSFRHDLRAGERTTIDKALAIVGRVLREAGSVFPTPDSIKCYLQLQLSGETTERFAVLFLDSSCRCIAFETLFVGTLTHTSVYPREVVLATLRHTASSVVLAHNHPSGSVQPSLADQELTQILKASLALIDVPVLDHVIVGKTKTLSMAQCGLL